MLKLSELVIVLLIFHVCMFICVRSAFKPSDDEKLHESQIPSPMAEEGYGQQQPTPEEIQEELRRLYKLFDEDGDGKLSTDEVKKWLDSVHHDIMQENLDRQWAYYEPVLQEVHSWNDYKPIELEVLDWETYKNKTFTEELMNEPGQNKLTWDSMIERAHKRWDMADANNDSILIKQEFRDFMWPEESSSDRVKDHLVNEALEDMDVDSDGLINMDEYLQHLISITPEQDRSDPEWAEVQQNHFVTYLDKDKSGNLDKDELKNWLTGQSDRHHEEAVRLIESADADKDQFLSIEEIVENYNNFFTLVPPKFWNKYYPEDQLYGTDENAHDEL